MNLPDIGGDPRLAAAIKLALEEDVGTGDVTTDSLVDPAAMATGEILSRAECRVAGGPVAAAVLRAVSPDVVCETVVPDGADVAKGGAIIRFHGPARAILVGERSTSCSACAASPP